MCNFTSDSELMLRWWNARNNHARFKHKATCDVVEDLHEQRSLVMSYRKDTQKTIAKRRAKTHPSIYSTGMKRTEAKQLVHVAFWQEHEKKIADKLEMLKTQHTRETCPACLLETR